MRVYVETNFLLELVFEQEQLGDCELVLAWAERGSLDLRAPAYSLFEASEAVRLRVKKRQEFQRDFRDHLRQIKRQGPFANDPSADGVESLLRRSTQSLEQRLNACLGRLKGAAQSLVRLDADDVAEARLLADECKLKSPDALVLASVLGDLQRNPSTAAFVTRDNKGFDTQPVRSRLASRQCSLFGSFHDLANHLRHEKGLAAPNETTPAKPEPS
ncbi:MAG TPA: hypothetical protein VFS43_35670 [Polyangiaceae bacterium]|nr:hypothetical protein [Polyangiaceae bacterium]